MCYDLCMSKYTPEQKRRANIKRMAFRKAHPEDGLANDRERASNFKILLAGLKSSPCKDCGGRFPSCAMDFDHVRGKKYRHIGAMGHASFSVLVSELAKCDLVCSNCHRIRTQGRFDV